MKLYEILDFSGSNDITYPYLLEKRHCVIRPQEPHLPFKLVNLLTGLSIDWVPSRNELLGNEWYVFIESPHAEGAE